MERIVERQRHEGSDLRKGGGRHLLQRRLHGIAAWPSSILRRLGNRRYIEGGELPTVIVLTNFWGHRCGHNLALEFKKRSDNILGRILGSRICP
jgi:hypothetical protein